MNCFIFLTMVLRADGTVTTNSGLHSQVVYCAEGVTHSSQSGDPAVDRDTFYAPIGHCLLGVLSLCCANRSWIFIFLSWKSHGKSMLKKEGAPWLLAFSALTLLVGE